MLFGEKYGRRVDVWSLGCTVYEMITGMAPWNHLKTVNELAQKLEEKQNFVIDESIDDDVKSFINYCCNYDRDKRPTSSDLLNHPFITNKSG